MRTFVVRLFVPMDAADADTTLRGRVEEIGADRSVNFADGRELLAFLEKVSSGHQGAPPERSLS